MHIFISSANGKERENQQLICENDNLADEVIQ